MTAARRLRAFVASSALFLLGPALPFALSVTRRNASSPVSRAVPPDPLVEVVVPAYLEVTTVARTVRELDEDLQRAGIKHVVTVVAGDDETAAAAARAGAHVRRAEPRGKPAAIDLAVEESAADVLVLTDANCHIEPPDWPALMLAELRQAGLLSAHKTEQRSRDSLFWRFEQLVKDRSCRSGGTLSVVGEFLACRREDFRPIPPGTICDDVWLAMDFDARGLPVTVSSAIVTSETGADPADQWERRVRIAEGQLTAALPRLRSLLHSPAGRQYAAHKLYRLTVGASAYWVAVCAFASLRPRLTAPLAVLPVAVSVLQYRGVLRVHTAADPVATVCALQAVPVAAVCRIVGRRLHPPPEAPLGWRKAAR